MPGIALDAAVNRFSGKRLISAYPGRHRKVNANIGPSQTLALGTVLGLTTVAVNDKQTVSCNYTPTGGTFTLTLTLNGAAVTTGLIAYNAAAAGTETGAGTVASPYVSVKGALNALLGNSGSLSAATGGALPGTPVVVTFGGGGIAGQPVPVMTVNAAGLTGGTPGTMSVAHTTTGKTANTYVPYSTSLLAPPTVAPTLSSQAGTLAAGTYTVAYSYVNAVGETTLSPPAFLAVTSTMVQAASIAIPTGATGINYYVSTGGNWIFIGQKTTAGTQNVTDVILAAGTQQQPLMRNTTCPAVAILEYDVATDAAGNVTFGLQSGSEWGQVYYSAPCYLNGDFDAADLTGLTADALAQLGGHMISGAFVAPGTGAITSGLVHIP